MNTVDVRELIEKDQFFIGSYPNNFSVGRWFSVEELANSSYGRIHKEYLERFNPGQAAELELGVFDVDNVSGLWRGEYDVSRLLHLIKEIDATKEYEIEVDFFEFEEGEFRWLIPDPYEAARMVYFGNIHSWDDDYLRFNGYGNLESLSEAEAKELEREAIKDLGIFQ
ncbi:hypothetical protein CIC46_10175 [Listeria monocytogenes]|nr:hypothetical protein [Listeria monocytogenes]